MRNLAPAAIVALALAAGCGDSAPPEPSTDADSGIERSQRGLIRDCLADPDACGPSVPIRAYLRGRREALRDCIESGDPKGCAREEEAVPLTSKLIASCLENADATTIETFGRRALRPRNLAESDLRELMRVCRPGTV